MGGLHGETRGRQRLGVRRGRRRTGGEVEEAAGAWTSSRGARRGWIDWCIGEGGWLRGFHD